MIVIRPEQTTAFRDEAVSDFESRAVRHLRTHLAGPTAEQTDEQLRLRVRGCIYRAGTYGLTSEKQIMCFTNATYLIGNEFDTAESWAKTLLASEKATPPEKSEAILAMAYVIARNRAAAGG